MNIHAHAWKIGVIIVDTRELKDKFTEAREENFYIRDMTIEEFENVIKFCKTTPLVSI